MHDQNLNINLTELSFGFPPPPSSTLLPSRLAFCYPNNNKYIFRGKVAS